MKPHISVDLTESQDFDNVFMLDRDFFMSRKWTQQTNNSLKVQFVRKVDIWGADRSAAIRKTAFLTHSTFKRMYKGVFCDRFVDLKF